MEIRRASSQKDFFALVQLRTEVFVLEQKVDIQIEQDTADFDAVHYIAYDDQQAAAGCLRILLTETEAIIGRVAVKKALRHQHIGQALMAAIEKDEAVLQRGKITLHAQESAVGFYEKCGYKIVSEPYYEAGIRHVMMEKKL